MNQLRNFITPLHKSAKRDYFDRMLNDKAKCIKIAKKYDIHYWDTSRRTGYGGYKYIPGHWKKMAQQLIETYNLGPGSKVLDVGCGKAFLLHEMKLLEPKLNIMGFDISKYALEKNNDLTKPYVYFHKAQDSYKYKDKEIDLVISLHVIHSLRFFDLKKAVKEISRVGKQAYVVVESYRNEEEMVNLQCWATVCECFFDVEEWIYLFKDFGYTGDYEFVFFE
jgi:ubiquinone/menaquinone biosynthesis C-methylase UbiE